MDWYEEWFDSPLYEKLYANRNEKEARQLIELLEETLSAKDCRTILDLACGRGRHSINLAEKGYDVTGIDLSEQSIKTATEKAEQRSIENVCFKVHDMRKPLDETFDAIVNLFTSFGYFSEDKVNAAVFDNVTKMLKPEGVFIIDYLNAQKVKENFVSSEQGSFKNIQYEIKRYVQDGAIYKEITFRKGKKKKTYSERVKLYELDWFKRQFSKRNLNIDKIYGDYHGKRYRPEKSDRLLIVAHLEKNK